MRRAGRRRRPACLHPTSTAGRLCPPQARRSGSRQEIPVGRVRYRDLHGEMRPMTGIDETKRPPSRSTAGLLTRPLRPYAEIFEIPGAWRFSAAAVIGKYGVAGTVSAVGSLGYAFSSPRVARAVDSYGQRRVLLPLLTVFTVATALLIVTVELKLPTWAFFVPGAVAGSAMPSLGAMVRARWSVLLTGAPRLHAAFSFESVADELCFIIGPAAVTLLATEVFPASGVGVAAVLCLLGTLWFAAERGTEPVAFAQHFGHKPLAGFILGTYALGSATGGIVYGTRHWRAPLEKRFALTLTLTVLGVATFWAQPNLISLTLIAGFSLLEAQAKPGRRTEAMSWLSSGISVGVAGGASVVGFVIDAHGPRFGYGVAALCGAASAATCLAGLRRLRT